MSCFISFSPYSHSNLRAWFTSFGHLFCFRIPAPTAVAAVPADLHLTSYLHGDLLFIFHFRASIFLLFFATRGSLILCIFHGDLSLQELIISLPVPHSIIRRRPQIFHIEISQGSRDFSRRGQ